MQFFGGLLVLGFGLLGLFKPHTAWYLSEGWKFRSAEPSEFYLVMNRVVGFILSIIGVVLLLSWGK